MGISGGEQQGADRVQGPHHRFPRKAVGSAVVALVVSLSTVSVLPQASLLPIVAAGVFWVSLVVLALAPVIWVVRRYRSSALPSVQSAARAEVVPVRWPPATAWSNRAQAIGGAVVFGFFALLILPGIFDGGKGGVGNQVFAGVLALGCSAMGVRSVIASSVRSSEVGVRVRALLRTRQYAWEDVQAFESQLGRGSG